MEAIRLGLPTLLLILAYLAGINVLGAWLGRGQKDARDYFLGSHAMPWAAVLGSIVATETSALTFLSVPGDAYRSGYTFLQLVFGYVVGRFAVAGLLLPGYFQREIPTAYALLEARFGVRARRFTSLLFMVTRVLAAAVRLAVPAIPIALILGIPVWAAIVLLAAGTALYTLLGGIRAVIWIDLIQVFLYLSGAVIALVYLLARVPGGLSGAFAAHAAAGDPVRLFVFAFDLARPYTFWAGLLGGAFLTMASHGADQLIVQRLLACRGLRDAQKALVGQRFSRARPDDPVSHDRRSALRLLRRPADRPRRGRRFPLTRRNLPDVHRARAAAPGLRVPRGGDLLGGHVLGIIGIELSRLRARLGRRRRRSPANPRSRVEADCGSARR